MHFSSSIGLVAALLALAQLAQAAQVAVTQISCNYLYFTLSLTAAEARDAVYLGVYIGDNMISEIQFNSAYANTNTYQWYAPFFQGSGPTTSGTQDVTFRLLDTNEEPIAAYPRITQPLAFQCGTTLTTSTTALGTATSSSPRASNTSGGGSSGSANDSGSGSGSSSSTGAIAGGVAGGVAALVIVGLVAFCLMRKKKKQNQQQSRLRNDEADEAAFRAPNNDSTTSLATAPETANTPMMRDISTKNVFADPSTSAFSGAPSGTSTQYSALNNNAASSSNVGAGAGAAGAAAAAGGIGAAAIAARKQSRENTRARSPSHASDRRPSSEFSKDNSASPSSQAPPPVPALPTPMPAAASPKQNTMAAVPPANPSASAAASHPPYSASSPATANKDASVAPLAAGGAAAAAATTAAAAAAASNKDTKDKSSKWGFKRASKDTSTNKLPYPPAVPESSALAPSVETPSASSNSSTSKQSAEVPVPASPSRSFKVIPKPAAAPAAPAASTAGPSSPSIAPSENSLNRTPVFPPRSGPATPAGSIRGTNYSRAPSVASMTAGFADAPPMPSGASVSSAPVSEFGGNMAGVGAGRSFAASSGNSTKWHQQSYNIMPNFSHRALARSTQLDEDLIFGHLGMGLTPPPGPAGNGSETGSSKSRTDPFGDR